MVELQVCCFVGKAKSSLSEDGVDAVGAFCEDLSGRPQHGRLLQFSVIVNSAPSHIIPQVALPSQGCPRRSATIRSFSRKVEGD